MNVIIYSATDAEKAAFIEANQGKQHELFFTNHSLSKASANLARGHQVACVTPRDELHAEILDQLAAGGIRNLVMRAADLEAVDLRHAEQLGISVASCPPSAPYVYAEYLVTMILFLHRGLNRVQRQLAAVRAAPGRSLRDKRILVIGDNEVARETSQLLEGFPCSVSTFDISSYASVESMREELLLRLHESEVVALHCSWAPGSKNLLDQEALAALGSETMLVSTGNTEAIDLFALTQALNAGHIKAVGLDVRENGYVMNEIERNPQLNRLLDHPAVFLSFDQAPHTVHSLKSTIEQALAAIYRAAPGPQEEAVELRGAA